MDELPENVAASLTVSAFKNRLDVYGKIVDTGQMFEGFEVIGTTSAFCVGLAQQPVAQAI